MNDPKGSFKASISWMQGSALTIGAVLGSGVLILPVATAQLAGPAAMVSWVLMGLLSIPLAITLGRLASEQPDAGGIAAYARRAFGDKAGAVTGTLFLGTVPIGGPICALIGANYISALFSLNSYQVVIVAAAMLIMAVIFNYRGIQLSGRVQIAVIGSVAAVLLAAVFSALPYVEEKAFFPFAPNGIAPIGVSMAMLFWAFVGWEMIVHLAEEFEDPIRDIPLSLMISIIIINIMYLSVVFVTIGTGAYIGPDNSIALAGMIGRGWGHWAGAVTGILGFLTCYGTIHTYVAGFSRLVYAQSRQGDFPEYFSSLHEEFHTPHRVLLVLLPVFMVVLWISFWFNINIGILIQFPGTIFISLYIIGMAAAVKLLPSQGWGRYFAALSLIMCMIIYCFTGWIGLYPFALGAFGWFVQSLRKRSLRASEL
ncbi:amino acid permease [Pelosinus baikalensis]|uniref:Amino acid permease n=1 Tax=Pelosinus baikalensis TaxID=2892015 RepID=A0ABS8HP09_9FIRM|nr:amino acid permease [Pelosinus baikalensis]MCC5464898.1 amino acid permease [Pelosinus baikalensis]